MTHPDIIVVGAGNAAFCAALAAREAGASVLMLERAPEAENGGNSRFTAGAFRFAYGGAEDIRTLCPDLPESQAAITDFGAYPEESFYDDMFRLTRYRTDPALCERLVTESRETMQWLHGRGVRFMPIYGRQAFKVDGRFRFWGGLTLEAWGGGPGLVDGHTKIARAAGIDIRYGARVLDLLHDGHSVGGVRLKAGGRIETVPAGAVVLAAGGFQANPEWRTPLSSAPAGSWRRCAAAASTPATASAWRWRPGRRPTATGPAATPSPGTTTRRNSAIWRSATASRSTATRGASWSTPRAGASSTRARTSATTPTPATAG